MLRATVLSTAALTAILAGPALANHGVDYNCDYFQYQEDAQRHMDAHSGDPDGLDRDDDGVACETLPRRGGSGTVPTGGVDAGRGGAASRNVVLPTLVLTTGLTVTVVGVRARRRTA